MFYLLEFSDGVYNILARNDYRLWMNTEEVFAKGQTIAVHHGLRTYHGNFLISFFVTYFFLAKVIDGGCREMMEIALELLTSNTTLSFNSEAMSTPTSNPAPNFTSDVLSSPPRLNTLPKFSSSQTLSTMFTSTPKRKADASMDSPFSKSAKLSYEYLRSPNTPVRKVFENGCMISLRRLAPTKEMERYLLVDFQGKILKLRELRQKDLLHLIKERRSTVPIELPSCLNIDEMEDSIGEELLVHLQEDLQAFTMLIVEYLISEEAFKVSFMPLIKQRGGRSCPIREEKKMVNSVVSQAFYFCLFYFGGIALDNETEISDQKNLSLYYSQDIFMYRCRNYYQNRVSRYYNKDSKVKYSNYANPNPIFTMDNAF